MESLAVLQDLQAAAETLLALLATAGTATELGHRRRTNRPRRETLPSRAGVLAAESWLAAPLVSEEAVLVAEEAGEAATLA